MAGAKQVRRGGDTLGTTLLLSTWSLTPGAVAVDQRLLQSAYERFNTLKKREGMKQLRDALGEMGVKLGLKELATALTTAGLTWGRPTQRQVGNLNYRIRFQLHPDPIPMVTKVKFRADDRSPQPVPAA